MPACPACLTDRLPALSACLADRLPALTLPCLQVLDDSTDSVTRELVDEKVLEWRERGVNVECLRRTNRQGYKAGAMKEVGAALGADVGAGGGARGQMAAAAICCPLRSRLCSEPHRAALAVPAAPAALQGMEALGREGYEFVAVFDADFKPEPGFLEKTVPYLMGNPQVGAAAGCRGWWWALGARFQVAAAWCGVCACSALGLYRWAAPRWVLAGCSGRPASWRRLPATSPAEPT